MSEPLNAAQQSAAQDAFNQVFASADPFQPAFVSGVEKLALLFPLDGYELHAEQFGAVAVAAERIGESEAFISSVELLTDLRGAGQWADKRTHYRILLDPKFYFQLTDSPLGLMRNAIYSVHGRWGLIISEESHALVGGPETFVTSLLSSLPPPIDLLRRSGVEVDPSISAGLSPQEQMVRAWLFYWKDWSSSGSRIDWLPRLLGSVIGSERAKELIDEIAP